MDETTENNAKWCKEQKDKYGMFFMYVKLMEPKTCVAVIWHKDVNVIFIELYHLHGYILFLIVMIYTLCAKTMPF